MTRSVQAGDLDGDDVTEHIDSGSGQNVSDVVEANVEASNGVAHAINEVLLPLAAQAAAGKRLVDLVTSAPYLTKLVDAVKVAVGLNIMASHVLVLTEGLNFLASWRIPRAHRWPELPGQLAGGAARVRAWDSHHVL